VEPRAKMGCVVTISKAGLVGLRDRIELCLQIFHEKQMPLVSAGLGYLAENRQHAVESLFDGHAIDAHLTGDLAKSRASLPKFEDGLIRLADCYQLGRHDAASASRDRGSLAARAQASPLPVVQSSREAPALSSSAAALARACVAAAHVEQSRDSIFAGAYKRTKGSHTRNLYNTTHQPAILQRYRPNGAHLGKLPSVGRSFEF